MDTPEKPKRPWWRKKRWKAAVAAWALSPAVYILGSGPAAYAAAREWLPWEAYEIVYAPLYWASDRSFQVMDKWGRYFEWWTELALEYDLASEPTP